jgi:hypothetical protein
LLDGLFKAIDVFLGVCIELIQKGGELACVVKLRPVDLLPVLE